MRASYLIIKTAIVSLFRVKSLSRNHSVTNVKRADVALVSLIISVTRCHELTMARSLIRVIPARNFRREFATAHVRISSLTCYYANRESRTRTIDMYRSLDGGFGSRSAIRQERPRVSVDEQRNPGNNVCQSFRRERRNDVVAPDKAANVSLQISIFARGENGT